MAFPWMAAATIASSALGFAGQKKANEQNLAIARENRAWQEKMSNTAYQRATTDLEAAGLNRILALGSPSSTPGGNVATMQNEGAAAVEGLSKGATSAMGFKKLGQEIKNMKAQEQDTRTAAAKKVIDMLGVNQSVQESKTRMRLIEEQIKALGVPSTVGEAAKRAAGAVKTGVNVPGVTDRASILINDIIDTVSGKAASDRAALNPAPKKKTTRKARRDRIFKGSR